MLYFWDSFSLREAGPLGLLADGLTTTGGEAVDAEGSSSRTPPGCSFLIQQDLQTVQTLLEALFTREVVIKKDGSSSSASICSGNGSTATTRRGRSSANQNR